jgi:hypothetical protein
MPGDEERSSLPQLLTIQKLESLGASLSDVASVLHSLSAAISAGSQVSAAEREYLLARLDSIISGMNQDRRDEAEIHRRIESDIKSFEREFGNFLEDRVEINRRVTQACDDIGILVEGWKRHEVNMAVVLPQVQETLRLTREGDDRFPDTGIKIPVSDRALKAIYKAAITAIATATALLLLSKLLPLIASRLPAQH